MSRRTIIFMLTGAPFINYVMACQLGTHLHPYKYVPMRIVRAIIVKVSQKRKIIFFLPAFLNYSSRQSRRCRCSSRQNLFGVFFLTQLAIWPSKKLTIIIICKSAFFFLPRPCVRWYPHITSSLSVHLYPLRPFVPHWRTGKNHVCTQHVSN